MRPSIVLLLLLAWGVIGALAMVPPAAPPKAPAPVTAAAPPISCRAPFPPPEPHQVHKDNALDRFLIRLLAAKLAERMTAAQSVVPPPGPPASFEEFALKTKELLILPHMRPGQQPPAGDAALLRQSDEIASILSELVPGFVQVLFRLTGKSRLACELHSMVAPLVSGWLVGPASRTAGEIDVPLPPPSLASPEALATAASAAAAEAGGTRKERWESSVRVERCRFLEAAGCRKACVYLCKIPTQKFFGDTLGTPMTLTPDFDDASCVFAFGQRPPPLEEDPAYVEVTRLGSCCSGGGGGGTAGLATAAAASGKEEGEVGLG